MKTEILTIIRYLSEQFFGSVEDPEDVDIKFIIEDEKAPYWYVETSRCLKFDELVKLNEAVEKEGHVLEICLDGMWVSSKESYEKRK